MRLPLSSLAVPAVSCVLLAAQVAWAGADRAAAQLGKPIGNVSLTSVDGQACRLNDLKGDKALVVVFFTFDCPVSTSYLPALKALLKKYDSRQVRLIGVCPTTDTAKALVRQARDFQLTFPIFRDADLKVAKHFQAQTVPEAFVLDSQGNLRYRGRIDDGYYTRLKKKSQPPRPDLDLAVAETVAGKAVSVASTQAIGCPIVFAKPAATPASVTYYRDVLPILQKRCQSCHRPGEVGPFALLTLKQAVRWADDIKTCTQSRQMPPWPVNESVPFQNERKLTPQEIATLAAWVDGGTPAGNPKEAPPPPRFTDGWQLGEPDLILEPNGEMTLAAAGPDLFRCFVLPARLLEDKFVTAYEVRPSNRQVVHHTLHFLDVKGRAQKLEKRAQDQAGKNAVDVGPGYTSMMGPGFFPPSGDMGGWAPGMSARHFPKGVGYYLPKGSDVILQVHYHRTGRVEKDRTRLGLHFSREPAKAIQPLVVPGWFTYIPAGAAQHRVQGSLWTAVDCTVYNITPHMHKVGKAIKVTMTPPGGTTVTLVRIDAWDYNWQETYYFQEPLRVKSGTKFTVEAIFDNSSTNPNNPFSPPRTIFPGEQTTNEMCFTFLDATTDTGGPMAVRLWANGPVIRRPAALLLPKQP